MRSRRVGRVAVPGGVDPAVSTLLRAEDRWARGRRLIDLLRTAVGLLGFANAVVFAMLVPSGRQTLLESWPGRIAQAIVVCSFVITYSGLRRWLSGSRGWVESLAATLCAVGLLLTSGLLSAAAMHWAFDSMQFSTHYVMAPSQGTYAEHHHQVVHRLVVYEAVGSAVLVIDAIADTCGRRLITARDDAIERARRSLVRGLP